jgi:chemotaxis protein MotB
MAARRRHVEEHEEEGGMERWLLTYADMITLLMVLFIVLFSIGQLDLQKFQELREGLAESFGTPTPVIGSDAQGSSGVLDGGLQASGDGLGSEQEERFQATLEQLMQQNVEIREDIEALQETAEQVQGTLEGQGLGDQVTYRLEPRGLVLNIVSDDVLFDSGRADLKPEGQLVLDGIANALKSVPNDVTVEGHTDNRPLNGGFPYPTNWELSTGRATAVVRYFVEQRGIDPTKISGTGYGEYHPLVPNDNVINQARNRRVEIVVLSSAIEALQRLQEQAAAEEGP